MAIEFRCTKCNKLLRTADDTTGKHAKCPACGEVLLIPPAGIPFSEPTPPSASPSSSFAGSGGFPPPPSGPAGGNPFAAAGQPSYQPETGNPYQSPTDFATMPSMPTATGEIRPTIFDLGDVMSRAWTIFKEQWAMCLGALVLGFICNFAFGFVTGLVPQFIIATTRNQDLAMVISLMMNLISQAFQVWIGIGQARIFLKIARGQEANMAELFSGGPYFLPILGASILYGLMVIFGMLLLIVPGVILALMFSQYYYLIIDRKMGVMDSLNMAKEISNGNKMTLFLTGIVCMGLNIAGALCCLVGLLVSVPYIALLQAVIYLAMTGQPTADQVRAGMGVR